MKGTGGNDRGGPGEKHASIWLDTTPETSFEPLPGDVSTDVAIVGGGIAGLTAATRLAEAGRDVAVIEAGRIVEGATGHTTAKLTSQHGLVYADLISKFGERAARQYAEANEAAIDAVAARVEERGYDCRFERRPAYTYTHARDERRIRREVNAARRLGLPASYVEETPLPFDVGPAVRFDDQAQFHPREYLLALVEDFTDEGGVVYERTRAHGVERGSPRRVETNRGTVTARDVVVATHFPFHDPALYFARMYPKQSYLLALRVAGDPPEGMFYGVGDSYRSLRTYPADGERLLFLGGENHKTGQGGDIESRYRRLERDARRWFDVESVAYRWTTEDFVSVDRVPYVGRLAPWTPHVHVATGFGGWGMSNGVAAGRTIADAILGRENPWASVFDPGRFEPLAGAREFVSENANVAREFVGDWLPLSKPAATDLARLAPGDATVTRRDGDPIAAHRDEDGELHVHSAVCPHMGCLVAWNDAERTWDCPCHGSRFEADGRVFDGPAVSDLSRYAPDGE